MAGQSTEMQKRVRPGWNDGNVYYSMKWLRRIQPRPIRPPALADTTWREPPRGFLLDYCAIQREPGRLGFTKIEPAPNNIRAPNDIGVVRGGLSLNPAQTFYTSALLLKPFDQMGQDNRSRAQGLNDNAASRQATGCGAWPL